jgi:ABC-type antimicrobial peptide transport system permease subunit
MFSYAIRKRKKQAQLSPFSHDSFSLAIIKNYFVVASRNLYRHKYFTIVNAVGLAIGMSVSLLLITLIGFVYTYDNFHEKREHIYRVISSHEKNGNSFDLASAPIAIADRLKNEFTGIESVTRIVPNFRHEVMIGDNNIPIQGFYVDPEFLSIFSCTLISGDKITALQKPNSIVLTESTAKKIFGDENAFGKIIEVASLGSFEVTGILKDPPLNTHMRFESLVSYKTVEDKYRNATLLYEDPFSIGMFFVYLVISDPAQLNKFENYLNVLAAESSKMSEAKIDFQLQALNEIALGPELVMMTGTLGPQWGATGFYIFGTICLLILLPACFNYANISIARALKRAKEIGLRKTMGGGRDQIFFQFITETIVVTTISLLGALLLFFLVRDEFKRMLTGGSSLDLSLSWTNVSYFFAFTIATGFVAGFAPALYFSKLNPIKALKSQAKGFSGMWIRKSLTVFQFILSFGFIVALIVFSRQYRYSLNYNFGFQKENILDVDLQESDPNLFLSEFSKLSSVNQISFSDKVLGLFPIGAESWMQMENKSDSIRVADMYTDHSYIKNLGMELIAGKGFPDEPWTHEQYLIVNESFVKTFSIPSAADAIGQVVRVNKKDLQIIGVLKDFNYATLHWEIKSFAFRMDPSQFKHANLKVSFQDAYEGINEMEVLWRKLGNTKKFKAEFLDDEINRAFHNYATLLKLAGFLGLLAISISLLGMLGMVVYTSESRTKEVGIRKVLGASVSGITFLLSKDYIKMMGWAFLIAIPLSVFVIDKMLSSMQHYRVRLTVWDILAGMLILMAMGLATLSSQTIKTASTNPAETLKSE